MQRSKLIAVAASLLVFVGGCGGNAVKLEVARSLADSTGAATAQTAAYFDEAESRRRAMAATYVAQDPSCLPKRRFKIQVPDANNPRGRKVPLCSNGKVERGYHLEPIDFGPSSDTLLKSRALLIAAVGDYGRALAKILNEKDADVKGELTAFVDKVERVESLVKLLDKDAPTVSGVFQSPQVSSIVDLVDFAAKLRQEADKVGGVERLVKQDGAKVDVALATLLQEVEVRAAGSLTGSLQVSRNALYDAYDANRYRMSFADRRAMALEIFQAQDEEYGLPQKAKVVADALRETVDAQKGLRAALRNDFTPAQRRKAAAINLDRITQAVKLVAAVGTAFI